MISVALVGAGNHSRGCHMPALRRYADAHAGAVRLAAVVDIDRAKAERARADFGFERAFGSIEDLDAAGPVDAFILVMPVPLIVPVAMRLLDRGIPMLVEKPLGRDLSESESLAAAVETRKAPVMVSMNRRFQPCVRIVSEWLSRQGPVRYVRGTMLRYRRTEADFPWSTGIHVLDLMCSLVGPLEAGEGSVMRAGADSGWCVPLRGPHGCAGWVEILPRSGRAEETVRMTGDDWCADLSIDCVQPWRVETLRCGKLDISRCADPQEPLDVRNGSYGETCAFLGAVRSGTALPGPSPADVLPASRLAGWLMTGTRLG